MVQSSPAWGAGSLPLSGVGAAFTMPLLDGDRGTEQTINAIRQVVWASLEDPIVQRQLAAILQSVPSYDDMAAVRAIYNWVHSNIRFTNNPVGHEQIKTPAWTIQWRIGDCNNINAELLPALLMSAGYEVRLVTVANDPSDPRTFTHVYCEVFVNGQWIPLDAARPGASFGTTVSNIYRKRVWSLVDRKFQDVGLSGVRLRPRTLRGGYSDDGSDSDWISGISSIIKDAGTVASRLISQANAPGYFPPQVFGTQQGPFGAGTSSVYGYSTGAISGNTIVLVLAGVVAAAMLFRK